MWRTCHGAPQSLLRVRTHAFALFAHRLRIQQHREGTGEYVDDSVITMKVKAAVLHEPSLKSSEINVETFKGVVQLSGFVGGVVVLPRPRAGHPRRHWLTGLPLVGAQILVVLLARDRHLTRPA